MSRVISVVAVAVVLLTGCERKPSGQKKQAGAEETATRQEAPRALGLTAEQLKQVPDDQLEELILGAMGRAIGSQYEREYEIVRAWSPGLRMFHATSILEGEVNNGGFNQYFWNTGGKFADFALEGLKLIGADQHAQLMERAIRIQEEEAPRMAKYKEEGTIEAFSKSYEETKLDDLDTEFFAIEGESLSKLRVKYIRAHVEEFTDHP